MRILLLAFFAVLAVVSYQDMRKMEIKDSCHVAIMLLAILSILAEPGTDVISRLSGALCVSVPMLVITLLIPGAFGGGDIKLMAAGGLFLGWKGILVSAVVAIFAAGGYVLILIVKGKAGRRQKFPFGPFLSAGMAVGALWGVKLWEFFM